MHVNAQYDNTAIIYGFKSKMKCKSYLAMIIIREIKSGSVVLGTDGDANLLGDDVRLVIPNVGIQNN